MTITTSVKCTECQAEYTISGPEAPYICCFCGADFGEFLDLVSFELDVARILRDHGDTLESTYDMR